MIEATDTSSLAFLFHLNSEPWMRPDGGSEIPPDIPSAAEARTVGATLELPSVSDGTDALLEVIRRRSSCRAFARARLSLDDLGALLLGAYGLTRRELLENGIEISARGAPSAGALYPLELYLFAERVDGLEDGLHHYNPREHAIERLRIDLGPSALDQVFIAPAPIENANVVLLISAVFERTLHKYGARGYRYVLLEAGHVAQDICLLAAERRLGSCCIGGFSDSAINAFVGVDARVEGVVYCVAIGHAATGD